MNTNTHPTERIHADHDIVKHLGNWSTAKDFDIRARHASVVIDLRSPQLPVELVVNVALTHASLTLLVDEHTAIMAKDIGWSGKGRVKNVEPAKTSGDVRIEGAAQAARFASSVAESPS